MNDIVTAYLKTWNATDPTERKALLDDHWTPEASYTDPMADVAGHDAISGVIGAVHTQFPGFVFSLISGPDSHHNQARFQWGLGPAGEPCWPRTPTAASGRCTASWTRYPADPRSRREGRRCAGTRPVERSPALVRRRTARTSPRR